MDESQRLAREQDLDRSQGVRRARRRGNVKPRELGGVPERDVIAENRDRAGQRGAVVSDPTDAHAQDAADDRRGERPCVLGKLVGAEVTLVAQRQQQLVDVERVARRRVLARRDHRGLGPLAEHLACELTDRRVAERGQGVNLHPGLGRDPVEDVR